MCSTTCPFGTEIGGFVRAGPASTFSVGPSGNIGPKSIIAAAADRTSRSEER